MDNLSRREFSESFLKTLLSVALLQSSVLFASAVRDHSQKLLAKVDKLSRALRAGEIQPREWQKQVEQIFSNVDLADLLRYIDFQQIENGFQYLDYAAEKKVLHLGARNGFPDRLQYGTAIFGMQRGRAIVPHGHRNMVSAHLILKGTLHLRNYERVADDDGFLIIKPTIDDEISSRNCSTISSQHNNVHWFTATSSTAFTFDMIVDGLDPKQDPYHLDFLDINRAEKLSDGTLRTRVINAEQSYRLYGNELHH